MPASDVLQRIREMFPSLAFLVNDRQVGRLLRDAVDPNKGFSPERFQAELFQTSWWKRNSDTMRQWQATVETNPGQAVQDRKVMAFALRQQAGQMGLVVSNNVLAMIRERALQMGLAQDDPMVKHWLVTYRRRTRNPYPGEVDRLAADYLKLAASYFVPQHGDKNARTWALRVMSGRTTPEAVEEAYRDAAVKRFPHLERMIRRGVTPEEYFSQHRAIIANELEVSEDQVDFVTNPTWSKVISNRDPKSGDLRPMTLHEAQILARSRPKWWKTNKGREVDANTAASVLQMFGRRSVSSQPQLGGFGLAS